MTITRALLDGIRRVNRAPAVLAGVVLLTLLMALPLGMTLRGMIAGHLGDSLAAERAATGVNWEWWQEFMEQASGVGVTFRPTIVGFGAVLANLSALADKTPQVTVVAAAATAYILVWCSSPAAFSTATRATADARVRFLRRLGRLLLPFSAPRGPGGGRPTACTTL